MNVMTRTIPFTPSMDLIEIFHDEQMVFFLDSSLMGSSDARYSYLGFSPFKVIQTKSFAQLKKELKPYLKSKTAGGSHVKAVGCIGYEGEIWFGLYESIICVDHHQQSLTVTSCGWPYRTAAKQKKTAQQRIDYVLYKIQHHHAPRPLVLPFKKKLSIKSNTTQAQYVAGVQKALKHIYDGDIYQINLSHRMEAGIKDWRRYARPVDIYQNLRRLSPSPFSAYLDQGARVILSSSPERFLKLSSGTAQVKPMKGTRPRSTDPLQDHHNKEELFHSTKEKAELLMVTDLERNDLGRVCKYGTVRVKDMRTIEEYSTVFQATSTVEGVLRKDCDQIDLLESTFPSGSVTGCPKIEAMKIIRKLEKTPRGLYTGALGYINLDGDMDFNVLIRTMFLEKDRIYFYVGGGIVADSKPLAEWNETLVKAKAMIEALQLSFSH